MRNPLTRLLRRNALSLLAAGFALLAACGSPRGGESGYEARIALVDLRDGLRWELRSESHTPPVELYSQPRARADIKVTTDEILAAAVVDLEQRGFAALARPNAAPTDGLGTWTRALEIEVGGRHRHIVTGPGASLDVQRSFNDLSRRFIDLFNEVQSFQHVENRAGSDVFQSPGVRVQGR